VEKDIFGTNFVDLLFGVVKEIYRIGLNGDDDYDMIVCTTLFIALIENNPGRIDHLIPYFIDTCVTNLSLKKSK
jgi:hypothetical protein